MKIVKHILEGPSNPSPPSADTCQYKAGPNFGSESRVDRYMHDRPLVDARQLSSEEIRISWPDVSFNVPDTLSSAVGVFMGQTTPRLILGGVSTCLAARLSCGVPLKLIDALIVPVVVVGWVFQEWVMHKYLLHELKGWMGYEVHERHHELPFYHVCIDPPELVMLWTLIAGLVFHLLLPGSLALTTLTAYMIMGGVYEWTHFIVHSRVVPRTQIGKAIKKHHTLHHLKDKTCWFGFTVPIIDHWLGTVSDAER